MKRLLVFIAVCTFAFSYGQTKSKNLKIKYTLLPGWTAEEFGGKAPWEESGNELCHCAGAVFTKQHKDGKMKVLVYPAMLSGLDSTKRNMVGKLQFQNVEKKDGVRSNGVFYERKRSNFTDSKSGAKSYDAFRFFAKVDDHFYIIYAWQESMQLLNSTNEKELLDMVKAIEPY